MTSLATIRPVMARRQLLTWKKLVEAATNA
jgi:hypothetical protein